MHMGIAGSRPIMLTVLGVLVGLLLVVDRSYAPLTTDDLNAAYDLLHPPQPPPPPPPPPKWYERWSQSASDWWNRDRLQQQQRELQKQQQDYQEKLDRMLRDHREQSERLRLQQQIGDLEWKTRDLERQIEVLKGR